MIERMNAFHFSITATLAYIHLSVLLSRIIIFLFKLFQMQTTTYIHTINQHKLSKVRSNLDYTFKILSLCLIYNTFKKYRASTTMKLSIVFITIAVVILYIEESTPVNSFQKDKKSTCNNDEGLWQQGKVPYEISHQFGEPFLILSLCNIY